MKNIRILDFTHYLSGPYATFQLMLQGAEVVKVEPLTGDPMRISPVSKEWSERGSSPAWLAVNGGKKVVRLDLKDPANIALLKANIQEFDVVVENFRPGTMDKLGLAWSDLQALHPGLVYCSISGFGHTGENATEPSFDGKIQALSGLMSLTGDPAGGPMRAGFPLADVGTGLMAAFGIANALYRRSVTGEGSFVDVAMLDSMLNLLNTAVAEHLIDGLEHNQYGNLSVSQKPTADRFDCKDGHIVLAALTDGQYRALMGALELQSLDGPDFDDWHKRFARREEIKKGINEALSTLSVQEAADLFEKHSVPCGRVNSISQILADPHLKAREMVTPLSTPYGTYALAGSAFKDSAYERKHIDFPDIVPLESVLRRPEADAMASSVSETAAL